MKLRNRRFTAPALARGAGLLVVGLAAAVPAAAAGQQETPQGTAPATISATRPAAPQSSPIPVAMSAPGIIYLSVSQDTIATIKTSQNVITRISLPEEATLAICGDLFDPATNAGSFIINRDGNDVFIKPVPAAKGQSNLFIKTKPGITYNFDLVVVPVAQAYRVANVNLSSCAGDAEKAKADVANLLNVERAKMQATLQQQFDARKADLEKQSADALEGERRKVRADADLRAGELATIRLSEALMSGFPSVPVVDKRMKLGGAQIDLDEVGRVFEGKLYVHYRITNPTTADLTYRQPKVTVRSNTDERNRTVDSDTHTSRGEYVVPGGETAHGVVVFERPNLQKNERLVLTFMADEKERELTPAQFTLLVGN